MDQQEVRASGEFCTSPRVQNGTYTVEGEGQHFTLKVYSRNFAQPGEPADWKRVVALLTGPDNSSDYTGVAFWDDEKGRAVVWKRHRGEGSDGIMDGYTWPGRFGSVIEKKVACWADLVLRSTLELGADMAPTFLPVSSYWAQRGYTIMLSGRCVRCNRELTDPESVRLGIGPVCGGRS